MSCVANRNSFWYGDLINSVNFPVANGNAAAVLKHVNMKLQVQGMHGNRRKFVLKKSMFNTMD